MTDLAEKREPTDEETMLKFQMGDAGAFDLLLKRHSSSVLRFIMKFTMISKSYAEDLLQEVFIKLIERRGNYDPDRKFSTWLYSLARNHCIDFLRSENHRRHISLEILSTSGRTNGRLEYDPRTKSAKNQEEVLMENEIRMHLNKALHEMKEEFREVFLLREVEALSLKEIADITGVPLNTVKSRLRYAYQNLRVVFIKEGYFETGNELGGCTNKL